jgi:hypothetical protein
VLPVINIDLHGQAVDSCDVLFGALGSIDVDFDLRVRTFIEFNGDELGARIEIGDPDASNGDIAACVFANLIVFFVIEKLLPAFASWIGLLTSDPSPDQDKFLRLNLPFHLGHIPQTESVVDAPVFAVDQDARSFRMLGDLRVVDDTDGHYFYFRVAEAIEGDEVLVMDQDIPAPRGDDELVVGQPARGEVISTANPSVIASDDVLARAPVNVGGVTQVRLSTDELHSVDGSILARVRLNAADSQSPFSVTQALPLIEEQPDIYFRVERGNQTFIDSRGLPNRRPVLVNFTGRGVGTPANPIVLEPLLVVTTGGVFVADDALPVLAGFRRR